MEWGAAQTVMVLAGALFLCVFALMASPGVKPASRNQIAAGIAAALLLATAFVWSAHFSRLVEVITAASGLIVAVIAAVMTFKGMRHYNSVPSSEHVRRRPNTSLEKLASNPATPATTLADLAYGEPWVRTLVASNPSTPANVLEWLASLGEPAITAALGSRDVRERATQSHKVRRTGNS